MPAYYSVGFQHERASVRPGFLRDLYATMLSGEFAYGGVLAWGCRGDLTLDAVIDWNQERLDRDFELGYTEHVSNNYRQILLLNHRYRECRVLVLHESRQVDVIVPEADVIGAGQLDPLKRLAVAVWQTGLFVSVQTYGELGAATPYAALQTGEPPSMSPIAIVPVGWAGAARLAGRGDRVSPVGENGLLLEE